MIFITEAIEGPVPKFCPNEKPINALLYTLELCLHLQSTPLFLPLLDLLAAAHTNTKYLLGKCLKMHVVTR